MPTWAIYLNHNAKRHNHNLLDFSSRDKLCACVQLSSWICVLGKKTNIISVRLSLFTQPVSNILMVLWFLPWQTGRIAHATTGQNRLDFWRVNPGQGEVRAETFKISGFSHCAAVGSRRWRAVSSYSWRTFLQVVCVGVA